MAPPVFTNYRDLILCVTVPPLLLLFTIGLSPKFFTLLNSFYLYIFNIDFLLKLCLGISELSMTRLSYVVCQVSPSFYLPTWRISSTSTWMLLGNTSSIANGRKVHVKSLMMTVSTSYIKMIQMKDVEYKWLPFTKFQLTWSWVTQSIV